MKATEMIMKKTGESNERLVSIVANCRAYFVDNYVASFRKGWFTIWAFNKSYCLDGFRNKRVNYSNYRDLVLNGIRRKLINWRSSFVFIYVCSSLKEGCIIGEELRRRNVQLFVWRWSTLCNVFHCT